MRQTFVFITPDELTRIDERLASLDLQVATLRQGLIMANAALAALQQQVTETNGVIASAVTLISGLSAQLALVQAELSAVGVTSAALDSLKESLDSSEQALAAAVAANAPADPVEPPPAT